VDAVLNSTKVASPLNILDCSPVSDGASAVIVCPAEDAKKYTDTPIYVKASTQASDTIALHSRKKLTTLEATVNASKKAYDIAKGYADNFHNNNGEGIIFTGGVGTGKTHLAAAICKEVTYKYSTTVEFVSYVQLLADIRAAFSGNKNIGEIEEKMMKTGLLVIDDLGKEKQSQFSNETLYRVVNERYKNELPVIITTNWPLETLSERLDYAVFSRLIGTCKVVEMSGSDYRMRDFLC
jgi:DNA replication protein DnaC